MFSVFMGKSVRFAHFSHRNFPPFCRQQNNFSRRFSHNSKGNGPNEDVKSKNVEYGLYGLAAVIAVTGLSYAAVPLYKAFCQATGYGGTTQVATEEQFKNMKPVEGARQITVYFNADTSASMPWIFQPQQRAVKVVPGETALAFYQAYNPTSRPVTGVSTYNITPMRAGLYFNKIQCFCFEEQRLRPQEEIDMPVFFYIDPKFLEDPAMAQVKSLTLSYTFFNSGEQEVLTVEDEVLRKEALSVVHLADAGKSAEAAEKVRRWTEAVQARTGARQVTNSETSK